MCGHIENRYLRGFLFCSDFRAKIMMTKRQGPLITKHKILTSLMTRWELCLGTAVVWVNCNHGVSVFTPG